MSAAKTQNVLRSLPQDPEQRKESPVATGVLDYFPLAVAEVARVSKAGNDQHNPGQPLHWARGKSGDHADCIIRHLIERGTVDKDGQRHTAKVAWRALAMLQEELEAEAGWEPARPAAASEHECPDYQQMLHDAIQRCMDSSCERCAAEENHRLPRFSGCAR